MKIIQAFLDEANRFKEGLSDARDKGKELITKLSKKEAAKLSVDLRKALESKGLVVSNLDLKLGRFRGFHFVTSCKISAKPKGRVYKTDEQAEKLLKYLQDEWSPKFKLKSVSDGEAHFNVR